jgi:hypothetical protein
LSLPAMIRRSRERPARSGPGCAPATETPASVRRGTARSASFIESRRRRAETVENRRSKSSTSP